MIISAEVCLVMATMEARHVGWRVLHKQRNGGCSAGWCIGVMVQ